VIGGILHRMILWELLKVFLVALAAITGILLLAGIVAEASQQGLGPTQILEAIPLLIPSTLPYTIPATTLFACCVVYGRLAADNEILAVKSAGVNILHVMRPALLLGALASAATMALYYDVIPASHLMLRQLIFNDAEELLYSTLKKHKFLSPTQFPYAIWVNDVQGRKLIQPTIKVRNALGRTTGVVQGKEAELQVDMNNKKLLIRMKDGYYTSLENDGNTGAFNETVYEQELPKTFGPDARRRERDMTWGEMVRRRRELEQALDAVRLQAAEEGLGAAAPPDLPERIKKRQTEEQFIRQQIVYIDVEMAMRPALAAGCFFFVLVGCPVGVWFSRSDFLSSFMTCFLPIVVVYYPLVLCGTGLAKDGKCDVVALVWAANAVMGVAGVVLFWRLLKR
jgi:lipopolysaccharide export system permease protein